MPAPYTSEMTAHSNLALICFPLSWSTSLWLSAEIRVSRPLLTRILHNLSGLVEAVKGQIM
jgi:hypothetical protein